MFLSTFYYIYIHYNSNYFIWKKTVILLQRKFFVFCAFLGWIRTQGEEESSSVDLLQYFEPLY